MSDLPRFGQHSTQPRQEMCPKHPGRPAVAYCKRCNRPACADCAIPTEVGSICVDCAGGAAKAQRSRGDRLASTQFAGAPVTLALIIANFAMYLLMKVWSGAFSTLAMSPAAGYFEPWRLLTATFLHAGFFHILFNMLMLFVLGTAVERGLGSLRFLAVYVLSALGGSMGVVAWVLAEPSSWNVAVVGASGALYGLFGAVFIVQKRSGMSTKSILILLAINLAYGFIVPGISWQGHVGGFIGGLGATAVYLGVADWGRKKSASTQRAAEIAVTVALFAAYSLLTWGLYQAVVRFALT